MHPFGHRFAPLGVQVLPLDCFWGVLKFDVFSEGSKCFPLHEKPRFGTCAPPSMLVPFFEPFPKGYPPGPEVTKIEEKVSFFKGKGGSIHKLLKEVSNKSV